jgi:hypothetical protein
MQDREVGHETEGEVEIEGLTITPLQKLPLVDKKRPTSSLLYLRLFVFLSV